MAFDPLGSDASGGDDELGVTQRLTLDRFDATEALADFPLLVTLNSTRVDATELGDGTTLRFRDSDGTLIPHEIEQVEDPLLVWVRVPTYAGVSTFLDMEYGDAAPSPSGDRVWNTEYEAVWHFGDAQFVDSSSHGRDGFPVNAPIGEGRVGAGIVLDSNHAYMAVAGLPIHASAYTLSGWMICASHSSTPSGQQAIVTREQITPFDADDFFLGLDGTDHPIARYSTSGATATAQTTPLPFGAWHLYASTWDPAAGRSTLYIDGVATNSSVISAGPPLDSPRPILVGGGHNGLDGNISVADDDFVFGELDEVRMQSVKRSDAWIAADHASETDAVISYGPILRGEH